ncbi:uncharacterized protein LOC121914887 [Sceloporus undulatus]|uniref:uncharacterized protein LOC121914887 n=1 Tax=Sceloporus undulatus TaxID=8520 RepID=UPI001C4C5194|nr:uncharacterized protein LOC121914887 [Sceloporus undulatus]
MSTGIWSDEPELLWPCDSQESTEKDQKEGAHVLYVCWQIRTSSCLWRIRRTLRLGSRGLPSNAKAAGITTLLPYICLLAAYITRLKEAGKSLRQGYKQKGLQLVSGDSPGNKGTQKKTTNFFPSQRKEAVAEDLHLPSPEPTLDWSVDHSYSRHEMGSEEAAMNLALELATAENAPLIPRMGPEERDGFMTEQIDALAQCHTQLILSVG